MRAGSGANAARRSRELTHTSPASRGILFCAGSVLQDAASGAFYMYGASMANGCGLNSWLCNSECVVAKASSVQGPYAIRGVAVGAFCHNPTAHRAPDGTVLIMHIGSGSYHDGIPPMVCHSLNGSTDVPPDKICQKATPGKGGPVAELAGGRQRETASGALPALRDHFAANQFLPGETVSPPNIAYSTSYEGPFKPLGQAQGWGANNPAASIRDDGRVLLVAKFGCNTTVNPDPSKFCRQFGVFTAEAWNGTYVFKRMIEVYGEDPFVWKTAHGYHLIADLQQYTPALPKLAKGTTNPRHAFSVDGLDWIIDANSSALPTPELPLKNGSNISLTRRERPQILFSASSDTPTRPLALFNGAALGNTHERGGDHTLTVVQPFVQG